MSLKMQVGAFRVGLVLVALSLVACNAVFGIHPGETGETSGTGAGGSTSSAGGSMSTGATGGTTSAGGATSAGGTMGTGATTTGGATSGTGGSRECGQYDGDGITEWTDLGGSNIPNLEFENTGSVFAYYNTGMDTTFITLAGYPEGFCGGGTEIHLAGPPIVGQVYTLVDQATSMQPAAFHAAKNAFVATGARPPPPGGDCQGPEEKSYEFISVAGMGEVKVTKLEGVEMDFTVTGVVTEADPNPDYAGTGMLGVDIVGFAHCYWDGT